MHASFIPFLPSMLLLASVMWAIQKVDWACLPTALFALTLLTLPYQEVVLVLHVPLEQLLMVLVQLVVTFARSLHTRHLLTCSTSELQQAQVQQILGSALM